MHFGFLANPQPLPRIVSRALIACALVMRVQIDRHPEHGEAADLLGSVLGWLEASGCDEEIEADERAVLDRPLGRLQREEGERFAWYGELAGVLAWAIQRYTLPAIDQPADALDVAGALDWLTEQGKALRTTARLRPREQLSAMLEVVAAADWRLQLAAASKDRLSMARWRADRMTWPPDVTPFAIKDDDLAVNGQAVNAIDGRTLLRTARTLRERHRAALWLLGQSSTYSGVSRPR